MSHKSPPEGTLEPPALHKSANNVQGNVQINVQGNAYKQCSRKCTFTIYTKEMFKEMSTNNVLGNVHGNVQGNVCKQRSRKCLQTMLKEMYIYYLYDFYHLNLQN